MGRRSAPTRPSACVGGPSPGIVGTGVAVDGMLLPDGAIDPHYTLTASADPNFPGPGS